MAEDSVIKAAGVENHGLNYGFWATPTSSNFRGSTTFSAFPPGYKYSGDVVKVGILRDGEVMTLQTALVSPIRLDGISKELIAQQDLKFRFLQVMSTLDTRTLKLHNMTERYIQIELDSQMLVVIDTEQARVGIPKILRDYSIPADRSEDLYSVLEFCS